MITLYETGNVLEGEMCDILKFTTVNFMSITEGSAKACGGGQLGSALAFY